MEKMKYLSLMLLCAAMCLSFTACSDDDDEILKDTTYTLIYDVDSSSSLVEINVTLFEYNEKDEVVGQNTVSDITKGYTEQFKASSNAQKVKVYVRMSSLRRWVQQVYYLESGSNIGIYITNETMLGTSEP